MIAQVLVRIFILIYRIIYTLTVKQIIVDLHILISRLQARSTITARGACTALVGNVSNGISASVVHLSS